MFNPFKINPNADVQKIDLPYFEKYYWQIDDFYIDPKAVNTFLDTECEYKLFKEDEPGLNGVKFEDKRHEGHHKGLEAVTFALMEVCKANKCRDEEDLIITNTFKVLDPDWGKQYKDNWWWPHLDWGWTALIYLNEEPCEGTNLYHKPGMPKNAVHDGIDKLIRQGAAKHNEYVEPWTTRDNWILGANIPSKFNRAIIFPSKIYHGMAIESDRWTNDTRRNQVVFFEY